MLILKKIFLEYGAFSVITLDKFSHRLARTFYREFNLPFGFEVSLDSESLIEETIDSILDEVYTFGVGIKWFGLSWRNDLGLRLKQNYPNNFIPIYLNDKEYVSLEDTIVDDHTEFNTWHYEDKNNLRLSDTIHGVKDTHLSSIGHEVVAKSILRKIK